MLDSGCIWYMTNSLSDFTEYIAYKELSVAMLADKQCITITIIDSGKIGVYIFIDRKPMQLILKNIFFSPTITNRTFFISYLNWKGFRTVYFNSEAYIVKQSIMFISDKLRNSHY